jgi:hypothetical protein
MGDITLLILTGAVSLIAGGAIGYFILRSAQRKHEVEAKEKADLIIKEANINADRSYNQRSQYQCRYD